MRDLKGDKTIELRDGFTVGREEGDLVFADDDTLSRAHCRFRARDQVWYVMDLGSKNGTELNGQAVPTGKAAPLKEGDLVEVGTRIFLYTEVPPEAERSSAPLAGPKYCPNPKCKFHETYSSRFCSAIGKKAEESHLPVTPASLRFRCRECGEIFRIRDSQIAVAKRDRDREAATSGRTRTMMKKP